jgi:hypothetical protein
MLPGRERVRCLRLAAAPLQTRAQEHGRRRCAEVPIGTSALVVALAAVALRSGASRTQPGGAGEVVPVGLGLFVEPGGEHDRG